jgi:hypothetical protein
VEIDTSKLTTKFDDWIEKDLLKISPWDVRRLGIEDYALVAVESGGRIGVQLDKKYRIDLSYDDKDAKWSLVKMEAFDKEGAAKDEQLPEGEELATAKLNDLRNALGDLKIVDVARKPSGLSAELKAEESFTNDREAVTSMQQRGFLPLKSGEILSTDGETIVGMRDGVEYVLRFGAPTTVAAETKASEGDAAGKDAAGETGGRYLLVMARFNEKLLEKPTLDPLPDVPGEGEKAADDKDKDAEGKKDAAAKEKDGDAAAGEKPADAAESLKKADETEAAAQAALENRRRVERENRRKQDAYDDKVKAAQKRVRELNNRFADWYYVVSDKEYAKIHLGRQTMVQKKEETKEAAAAPVEPAP